MPAPEETADGPAVPEGGGAEEPRRAGRDDRADRGDPGGLDPGRTRRRRLIGGAVLVVVLVVALRAAGIGQGDGSDDEGGDGRDRAASTSTAAPSGQETSTSGAAIPAATATTTTVAPPDVARPRPPVDLAVAPPGGDVIEVARWWAAAFVAYEGAEPAQDLVARLAAFTTPAWQAELLGVPPAASYDAPVEIAGASAQAVEPAAGGTGGGAGGAGQTVQVTVETAGALVVYELVLVQDAAGTWQVDRATRRV